MLRWPGTVKGWPAFNDDELVFTEAVDKLVKERFPLGGGELTREEFVYYCDNPQRNLKNDMKALLRPADESNWMKISNRLCKESLIKAVHHEVGAEQFSSEGAGWIQEYDRIRAVLDLQGEDPTDEETAMFHESGLERGDEGGMASLRAAVNPKTKMIKTRGNCITSWRSVSVATCPAPALFPSR